MEERKSWLTEEETLEYIRLSSRIAEMNTGINWKPEYAEEGRRIEKRWQELRTVADAERARRELAVVDANGQTAGCCVVEEKVCLVNSEKVAFQVEATKSILESTEGKKDTSNMFLRAEAESRRTLLNYLGLWK